MKPEEYKMKLDWHIDQLNRAATHFKGAKEALDFLIEHTGKDFPEFAMQSQAQQPTEAKPYGYVTTLKNGTKHFYESMPYLDNAVKCDTVYLQSQAQQESKWFPIETAPKNKKIIVTYKNSLGKNRTVFAKYIEKFTEESTFDTECETDYCEEEDTFYLKEGWVELIDNWDEFSSVYFDSSNIPTHWMPLPPAPEGEKP